jgi:hypothetical protein
MNSKKKNELLSSKIFTNILENKKELRSNHSSLERRLLSNTQNNYYSFKDFDSSNNYISKERHSIVQKAKLHAINKINDKSPVPQPSIQVPRSNHQSLQTQTYMSNSSSNYYPSYDTLRNKMKDFSHISREPNHATRKVILSKNNHEEIREKENSTESVEQIYYHTDFNRKAYKTNTQKSDNLRIYDYMEDSISNDKELLEMVNYYTSSIKVLQTDPGNTGNKFSSTEKYNNRSYKPPEKTYSIKPPALDKNKTRKYFWGYEEDLKGFKRERNNEKFYSVNDYNSKKLSDYILKNRFVNKGNKSQTHVDQESLTNPNGDKLSENQLEKPRKSRGGIVDLSVLNYRPKKNEKESEVKVAELSEMNEEENEFLLITLIRIQRWWRNLYHNKQQEIKPVRLNRFDRPTAFILTKQHETNLFDINISKIQNLWKIRKIRKEILKKKKDSTYDMTSFTEEIINKKKSNLQIINNQDNAINVIREKKPITKPVLNSDFVQKKVKSMNFEKGIKKIQNLWKKYKKSLSHVKRKIKLMPYNVSKKVSGPINTYLKFIIKIQRQVKKLLNRLREKENFDKLIVPKINKIPPYYLSKEFKTNFVPKLKNINLIQPIFITKENKCDLSKLKVEMIIKNMKRFMILQNLKKIIKNKKPETRIKPTIPTCKSITKNTKIDLSKRADKIKTVFLGFKARQMLMKLKLEGVRKPLVPPQFITKSTRTSLFNRKAIILQKAFRKFLSLKKKPIKINKNGLTSSFTYITKASKSNLLDVMSIKISRAMRRFLIKSKIRQSKILLPVTKPKATYEYITKSNKTNFLDKKVIVLQKLFKKLIANKKKPIQKIRFDESYNYLSKCSRTNYFDFMASKIIKAIRRHVNQKKFLSKKLKLLLALVNIKKKNEETDQKIVLDKWSQSVKKEKEKLNKFIENLQRSECYRFLDLMKRHSDQIDLENENQKLERIKNSENFLNTLSDNFNNRQKSSTIQDLKNFYESGLNDKVHKFINLIY